MLISVASDRSRKFRSITARITEIDKKLGSVSKTIQTVTDGLGDDAVSENSLQSGSITSDALQIEAITADKIAPSVFENASSGIQRVPASLKSVDYWNSAIYGNITAFTEAYFADKENKNVEATENGILFSPESNSSVIISKAEMLENGLILLTTDVAHNYETFDYINVQNLGSPFDGEWVITDVPTTTTIIYTLNQFEETSTNVDEDVNAYIVVGGSFGDSNEAETPNYKHSIIRKSFVDGVVTLTLFDETDTTENYQTHGYKVGYTVNVIGLGSPYDGVHRITYVPETENNIIQYRVDNKTIAEFEPKIALTSAFGDGEKITYQSSTIHEISVNQVVKITGFTTTTGYNLTGRVSGVYGGGSTFTIDSTVVPATNSPETGGTYECKIATVTADADSVLFLTGKNPVPTSRNVLVSWSSNKPIKVYAVVWLSNLPDSKFFTEIDSLTNPNVYDLTGINNYLWEITEDITNYAIYAEVLAGGEETLLQEFYVFEAVGNQDKKIYKIIGASVEPVANNVNKITVYTNAVHPYSAQDLVILSNMETISNSLNNKKFEIASVSEDKKSFVVENPTFTLSVETTNGSFLVNTSPTKSISDDISIEQPFTSNNITALSNSFVTALVPTITTTNTKTGLVATLTAGSNAVTLTTGNTEGMFVGQSLLKTSGTGAFVTAGSSYVANISSTTQFTTTANHATSGAITFNAATETTSFNSFRVSNASGQTNTVNLTFYVPTTIVDDQTGLVATLTAGSNTINLTTGNTNAIYVGQFLTKTSGSGAFGNSGLVYVTSVNADSTTEFTVDYDHDTNGSTTFKVSSVGKVSLDASVIGGNKQGQVTTLGSNGLTQKSTEGGQSVNLTDDNNTDNHLSIKTTEQEVVASISSTGAGTFKTLDADSLSVDTDITIGSANTALVGTFIDANYNGKSYGGALLNRFARGTIYQAYWLTPSTVSTQYLGLAAGTFKLDSNRLYQVFASASGMRASVNTNVALELMVSTTPIRVEDSSELSHMSYTHPSQRYETTYPYNSSGTADNVYTTTNNSSHTHNVNIAHTHYVDVFNSSFWRDLLGHFYSTSPTPTSENTTTFAISSWSRATSGANANAVFTLPAGAGSYLNSNISNASRMFIGVETKNYNQTDYIDGTYELHKISDTSFRVVTSANTTISTITRKTNLEATLSTGTSLVTLTTGNTSGLTEGQRFIKTGGTGEFGNSGEVYVNTVANLTSFFVVDAGGVDVVNHSVAGPITFEASAGRLTLVDPIMSNTQATFTDSSVVASSDGTNHTYAVKNLFQTGQLVDVDSSNNSWNITGGTIVSADSTHFVIKPSGTAQNNGNTNTATTVTAYWNDRQRQLHRNYLPANTDLYYVLRLRHQVTPSSYSITLAENPNSMLAITDLGQAKDMTFVAQGDTSGTTWTSGLPIGYSNVSSTDTTTVTETQTLSVSDSAYYDNYGKGDSLSIPYAYKYYLYQGNPGTASGVKKSAVLFAAFNFTGKTNGLSIKKLEIYLRNRHSYLSTGLTVYLGAHSATSLGSTVPLALDSCVATTSTFTKGQGKWITLPSSWHSTFSNGGGGRGILIGLTDENPDTYYDGIDNYGYFDGVTQDDPPKIRITYTYEAPVGSNNNSGGGGSGGGYIPI